MNNPLPSVLIIDDNLLFADRLSRLLTRIKIQAIDIANNYYEALQKLESFDPDIILVDINLPGRNGIELVKKIRQFNFSYNIIVLYSHTESHTRNSCRSLGVEHFLDKANDLHLLPEIINSIYKN